MRIINLKKKLGEFELDIPEFEIKEGITHGFIGINGSGKTTLAKLIMGLIEPDSGFIDREGLHMEDMTMTQQRPYLIHTSVYENICYPLKIRKITGKEKEIDDYLQKFGIMEKKHQYAPSLSSGERQKVSLIRALIFEPSLLIIDESLSNMDMESKELMENIIKGRQENYGKSCVLISHQMSDIYRLCQEVHFFENGRLIESGSTESVFSETKHPVIRKYIDTQRIEVASS